MKRFSASLSWKLTLWAAAMSLALWLAVGAVLVLSTAGEIRSSLDPAAQALALEYREDGYLQALDGYQSSGITGDWLDHAVQLNSRLLFPSANREPGGRYLQYSAVLLSRDGETGPVMAETLTAIQIHSAPEEPWKEGYLLFLKDFSPQDLYDISRQLSGDSLPPLTAVGVQEEARLRHLRVDSLTLGDRTYTSLSPAGGSRTVALGAGLESLPAGSYTLTPALNSPEEWEIFTDLAARFSPAGFDGAGLARDGLDGLLLDYAMAREYLPAGGSGDPPELVVILAAAPLKTALAEHASVLLCLLFLVPLLGLAFALAIRRTVVVPLRRTQENFRRVAALDFRAAVENTARRDEIGDLDRSLTQMAGELERRWDDERALERRRQDFAAAASHELKTPLALMRGYTEGLAQGVGDREAYLAGLEREIGRMDRLVAELLEQTRLERMEELARRERVDLTALVRGRMEELAPLFSGLRVERHLAEGVVWPGDRILLERAVGSLLSNAAQYCTPGGRVSVTLEQGPLLRVENSAQPIPEEELPRLFELFYRGSQARDRPGSGLGLPIAQRIFTLHHLACRAENTAGGVRFTLFPRRESAP